jgi:predicted secreted protein
LVQENSTPLAASFNLSGAVGFVSTRIKMGKTSEVDALVTAGGFKLEVWIFRYRTTDICINYFIAIMQYNHMINMICRH